MIKTGVLEAILKYTLASGKLQKEKPLSILFIAEPECGKTQIIRKFSLKTSGIFYTTDATAFGIIRDTNNLNDFVKKDSNRLHHIVIPDLLTCLARRETTVNTFIHFMNSMIEEGVVNMNTFGVKLGSAGQKKNLEIKAGLVTAITPKVFEDKRYRWNNIGFLTRTLPVTYKYKRSTRLEIMEYIKDEKYLKEILENLKIPKETSKNRIVLPKKYSDKAQRYSIALSEAQKMYGFRLQKQLQTLLKSIALYKGKKIVDNDIFDEFEKIIDFINYDFNAI